MIGQLTNSSAADMVTLCQYYADVMAGGKWLGEDVITMMADYLRCEIHVFMYVGTGGTSPMKYLPASSITEQLLLVAFYEPGRFRCVSKCHPPPGPNGKKLKTGTPLITSI